MTLECRGTSFILGGMIITVAFAIAMWMHSEIRHVILVPSIVG